MCLWALQVIFALNQTLLQQESLRAGGLQVPYTTEDLIRHYNCGDLNSIIFNHDRSQVRWLLTFARQMCWSFPVVPKVRFTKRVE